MKNFYEIRKECPWYDDRPGYVVCNATLEPCTEAHCAIRFWIEAIKETEK